MDSAIEDFDAWRGILNELRAVTGYESRGFAHTQCSKKNVGKEERSADSNSKGYEGHAGLTANVRIVEWSERSLTIVWHDPTACSYDDQHWKRAKSTRAGVCAVSGSIIHQGQDVFKPGRSKPPPANAGAMILVSALPVALNVSDVFQLLE